MNIFRMLRINGRKSITCSGGNKLSKRSVRKPLLDTGTSLSVYDYLNGQFL